MLPQATASSPAARRIASSIPVVVVLPLVPVTASHAGGRAAVPRPSHQASSGSPTTGTPAARGRGDERVVRAAARAGDDQARSRPAASGPRHRRPRPSGRSASAAGFGVGDGHPRAQLDQRRGGGEPGDAGPGDQHRRAGELGEPHDAMPDEAVSHSL